MKKGFTLIETIAVVIILGLLFALVYPSISKKINDTTDLITEAETKLVLEGAKDYIEKTTSDSVLYSTKCVTVNDLIEGGYLSKDSITNISLNSYVKVELSNTSNYTIQDVCTDINGLFNLIGDETVNVSLNGTYTESGATFIDPYGVDRSSDITVTYYLNNEKVNSINTTSNNNYIAKYLINGYEIERTIVVKDMVAPVILFDKDPYYIDDDFTTYSLYNGVTVTDDSDYTLKVAGNIALGVLGTYKAVYTATDTAGNVTVATRTIIVTEDADSNGNLIP